MMKSFDASKFRKSLTKNIPGMSVGFRDPDTWISTGNYALNKIISGDYFKGIPLGKVSMLAGESGSGKSFLASGNMVKDAQKQGVFVVLIDTENALDESWLKALDVDTSEDKLLKLNMAMIDDVAKTVSDFVSSYRQEYGDKPQEERPKILFVIDSLGMLMTPTEVNQFDKGEVSKGDMGRKAKALKAFVTNCVNMFGDLNIGMVCTNHVYDSQDMFNPDAKVSGGNGMIFASSIVITMQKLKLKEDEHGNKIKDEVGIRSACKVAKTRYAKPFQAIKVHIPYDTGMSPYSGIIETLESVGILVKDGNKLGYTDTETGEYIKHFRKGWTDELLHHVMVQSQQNEEKINLSEKVIDKNESHEDQEDQESVE